MKILKEEIGELSARIKSVRTACKDMVSTVYTGLIIKMRKIGGKHWLYVNMLWTQKEDEKLTEDFFELIFSAFDCNVEVDLNAEEYEFWWEKVMQVCDRVAVFSGAGWAQKVRNILKPVMESGI